MENEKGKRIFKIEDIESDIHDESPIIQVERAIHGLRVRRSFHSTFRESTHIIDIDKISNEFLKLIRFGRLSNRTVELKKISHEKTTTINNLVNKIITLEERLDKIEKEHQKFDPFELFGLNNKSPTELEKIAKQETISVTIDDLAEIWENDNE